MKPGRGAHFIPRVFGSQPIGFRHGSGARRKRPGQISCLVSRCLAVSATQAPLARLSRAAHERPNGPLALWLWLWLLLPSSWISPRRWQAGLGCGPSPPHPGNRPDVPLPRSCAMVGRCLRDNQLHKTPFRLCCTCATARPCLPRVSSGCTSEQGGY